MHNNLILSLGIISGSSTDIKRHNKSMMMATISDDVSSSEQPSKSLSNIYSLFGILSSLAWIVTSYVALSYHPDPKFADCTLRHNLLTMGQAFAFPLPVFWSAFEALRNRK